MHFVVFVASRLSFETLYKQKRLFKCICKSVLHWILYLHVADGLAVVNPGIPVAEEMIKSKSETNMIPEHLLFK